MRIPVKVKNLSDREPDDDIRYGSGRADYDRAAVGQSMSPPDDDRDSQSDSSGQDERDIRKAGAQDEASDKSESAGVVSCDDISGNGEPDDWKDKYLRLLADFENHKRNAAKDKTRLVGLGKDAVLDDLFPIVEHIEMAIQAAQDGGDESAILEGVQMVYRQLISMLEKHGVERIASIGETFDPAMHEAVAVMQRPGFEEGTIIEETRPGFKRQGKLLRPALVVVAG